MKYALNQSTAPTAEPVTLEEAKAQCHVTHDAEDVRIEHLIRTAREEVETYTGRQCMTATWDLYLDRWPVGRKPILLPKNPVQSVTSITYTDTAGASQTWSTDNYGTDLFSEPARIILKEAGQYPELDNEPNAIRVRFVAGYTTTTLVPAKVKAAILLNVERQWMQTAMTEQERNLLISIGYGDEFAQYGMAEVGYG